MSKEERDTVLGFVDHHRQRYAEQVRVAEEGEFLIGDHLPDGSLGPGGEFRVELVELQALGSGPSFHPRLSCFGDGVGSLRRAIDAGLLGVLGPVTGREGFARRLIAIEMDDRSDRPLPGVARDGPAGELGSAEARRSR